MNKFRLTFIIFLLLIISNHVLAVSSNQRISIINDSGMSVQTTITFSVLDPYEETCMPSSRWYMDTLEPRTSDGGIIRSGREICQLEVMTVVNGITCLKDFYPSPKLVIFIPNQVDANICNRIGYYF